MITPLAQSREVRRYVLCRVWNLVELLMELLMELVRRWLLHHTKVLAS